MCRGTKIAIVTKKVMNTTIDADVYAYLDSARGMVPRSTYVNAILRNAMNGEPVEC